MFLFCFEEVYIWRDQPERLLNTELFMSRWISVNIDVRSHDISGEVSPNKVALTYNPAK